MDWIKDWLPLITTGIMLAFGAAIWAVVRNLMKTFDSFLSKKAPQIDSFTEKYMGDAASDEMWRQIRTVGESLVRVANEMIALDSFQKNNNPDTGKPTGTITDLSDQIARSDK